MSNLSAASIDIPEANLYSLKYGKMDFTMNILDILAEMASSITLSRCYLVADLSFNSFNLT